ncbi:MAG TPA: tetratricopeptide repeat protein [Bryobacteraceae bacterium]|nr:tetratricopeptide repeat protein [Bryobacteraceae bacterium]
MAAKPWVGLFAVSIVFLCGCSKTAPQYIKRGNELYAAAKYKDAVLNYRAAIKKEPKSSEARYRLALAMLQLDQGYEAYQELANAVALDSRNIAAKVALAKLALSAYKASARPPAVLYNQARTLSDALLADAPNSTDGLELKAAIALIDHRAADAVALFRQALRITPDSAELQTSLAEALLKNNQTAEGQHQAQLAIDRHPDYTPAYDLLYTFYMAQQRPADAESLLKVRRMKNPSDASAVVNLAGFYYQTQRPQEGEVIIQSLRDRRGVFPQADLIIGDFHSLAKNWTQALADYNQGLAADKTRDTTYRERIASVLTILGRRDEALKATDEILAKDARNILARTLKIELLDQSDDVKNRAAAAAIAKELANDARFDARAQMTAGEAFMLNGNLDLAEQRFRQAAAVDQTSATPVIAVASVAMMRRNYQNALDLANYALTLKPGDEPARMLRVAALTVLGSYTAAKTEAQQLAHDSSNPQAAQTQLAVIAMLQKHYGEAEAQFRKVYEQGGSNLNGLVGLVRTYQAENLPNRALELLQSEAKRTGNSLQAQALLVDAAEKAGKRDVALVQLRKMAAENPGSLPIQIRLADEERLQGNLAAALDAYHRVKQLDPKNKDVDKVIATVQQDLGDNAAALASYRKALQISPDDPAAANNLALLLADSGGDLDEALKLATNALRKAPNSPGVQDTLAWIYVKRGDAAAALPILSSLTRKYPNIMVVRYHYAVALLKSGERTTAKREFETVLAKNPPKLVAASIHDYLKEAQ